MSEVLGEPYTPPGRAAVFDVPSYDDVADLNALFKRFANTTAALSEVSGSTSVLVDKTSSFTVSDAEIKGKAHFLCSSASPLTVTLPAPSSYAEGASVAVTQGGAGAVSLSGVTAGTTSTSGAYQSLVAIVHGGKWWCLPFGSGSGPGPTPADLLPPTLTVATGGDKFVHLDWIPNPASAPATGFKVVYAPSAGGQSVTVDVGLVTSRNITGLVNGTSYDFSVVTYDASRSSVASNVLSASPAPDDPGELLPPTLDIAAGGDGKVDVAWTKDPKCGPFTGYVVEWSLAGAGSWSSKNVVGTAVSNTTVSGLENGKTYSFRVRSVNTALKTQSLPSNVLNASTTSNLLPPTLTKAVGGNQFVHLEWQPNPQSAPVEGFKVQFKETADSTWSTVDVELVTSWNVSQLVNGRSYVFRVFGYDAVRQSVTSNELTAIPESDDPGELLPPSLDSAIGGDGSVTVSWTPDPKCGIFTGYSVEFSVAGSGSWSAEATGKSSSYQVQGLKNGTEYSFRVKSVNSNTSKSSLPSNVLNATPGGASTLNPPNIGTLTEGDTLLSLTWSPPASGAVPTQYVVEWAKASGKYERPDTKSVDPLSLTWEAKTVGDVRETTINGLTNDVMYVVRVKSKKDASISLPSDTRSGTPHGESGDLVITGYDDIRKTDDYTLYIFNNTSGFGSAVVKGAGKAKVLVIGGGGGCGAESYGPDYIEYSGNGGGGDLNVNSARGVIPEIDLEPGEYQMRIGPNGGENAIYDLPPSNGLESWFSQGRGESAKRLFTVSGGGGGGSQYHNFKSINGAFTTSGGGGGAANENNPFASYGSLGGKGGDGSRNGGDTYVVEIVPGGFVRFPGAGGGIGGPAKQLPEQTPGWIPADSENPAWKLFVTEQTSNDKGFVWGFGAGGPVSSVKTGDVTAGVKNAYGMGVIKGKKSFGGAVIIGVAGKPIEVPDIVGGAKYVIDGWVYHVFDSAGSFDLKVNGKYSTGQIVTADIVVVGGGGGGGYFDFNYAEGVSVYCGGGGGGEVALHEGYPYQTDLQLGTYAVVVGAGGPAANRQTLLGQNGSPSSIKGSGCNIIAIGGGGGASGDKVAPSGGASGGGAGAFYYRSQSSYVLGRAAVGAKGFDGCDAVVEGDYFRIGAGGGAGGSAKWIRNPSDIYKSRSCFGIGWQPNSQDPLQTIFDRLDIQFLGCGAGPDAPDGFDPQKDNGNGQGGFTNAAGNSGWVVVYYPVRFPGTKETKTRRRAVK